MTDTTNEEQRKILEELFASVVEGDEERCVAAAEQALEAGIPPLTSIEDGLTPGIREVGDRFSRMDMFLPEMVLSARAMQAAVDVLEPHFTAKPRGDSTAGLCEHLVPLSVKIV